MRDYTKTMTSNSLSNSHENAPLDSRYYSLLEKRGYFLRNVDFKAYYTGTTPESLNLQKLISEKI